MMGTEYSLPGQHELPLLEQELYKPLGQTEQGEADWVTFMTLCGHELGKLPPGNYRWRDLKKYLLDQGVKEPRSTKHWGALATRLRKHTSGWTRQRTRQGCYIKSSPSAWQHTSTAPHNRSVIVKTADGMEFRACLVPDAGQNEQGETCDLWTADGDQVAPVPDCWHDGYCWAVNMDGKPSDPVVMWREPVR